MNKTTNPQKPYVDPFLYEIGFFKDETDREKMVDGVRKMNKQRTHNPKPPRS